MLLRSFTDTKPLGKDSVFIFSLNFNKFSFSLSNSRLACLMIQIFSFINLAADVFDVVGWVAVHWKIDIVVAREKHEK